MSRGGNIAPKHNPLCKTNNSPGEHRDYYLGKAKVEQVYQRKAEQKPKKHSSSSGKRPAQPQTDLTMLNLSLIKINRHVLWNAFVLCAAHQAYDEEQDNRTTDRDQDTVKVKPSHSRRTNGIHQESANQGTDDTHDDIGECAHLGITAHNHAGNPSSQRTQENPD